MFKKHTIFSLFQKYNLISIKYSIFFSTTSSCLCNSLMIITLCEQALSLSIVNKSITPPEFLFGTQVSVEEELDGQLQAGFGHCLI